jgi:hypothetical protein
MMCRLIGGNTMSGVSGVGSSAVSLQIPSSQASSKRPTDGDTPAQEAAESVATKTAEKQNAGYAPRSAGLINKIA